MRHFYHYVTLMISLALFGGGLSSCSNDDTENSLNPSVETSIGTVGSNTAEIIVSTTDIAEYAWLCYPAASAIDNQTPAQIFATGTKVVCKEGKNVIAIANLEVLSEYVVLLAAKTTPGDFYDKTIAPIKFKTTDYTEDVTFTKRTLDGIVAHVKMPEEVTKRGNVLKWSVGNVVIYNRNKAGGMVDAEMTDSHDDVYAKFFDKDIDITIDEAHRLKANGEEEIEMWDFIAPGEPLIFMLGEYAYGDDPFGWGMGWYLSLFDRDGYAEATGGGPGPMMGSRADAVSEDDFWTGYHKKIEVRAMEPTVFDAKVKFETENLSCNGGILRFTPDVDVFRYSIGIFDDNTYEGTVLPYLDFHEEYLQWLPTSLIGMFAFGTKTVTGPVEILLNEFFNTLVPGGHYHVLITGMSDASASSQCFAHETFDLPLPTLPIPVVNVKGISNPEGADSPYQVWFNIKAPNKDVKMASYVSNEVRAYVKAFSQGYNYKALINENKQFGMLDSEAIAEINSDAGYNMCFNTLANTDIRVAVMGYNAEGFANDPDAENSPSVADMRSIRQPDASRVESALFTDLVGEWTATATVKLYKYDYETGAVTWEDIAEPAKSKVTIAAGASYPATLPSDVYAVFPEKTKDEIDALYSEFKNSADIFNSQVRGQNRLLCVGFEFDVDPNAWSRALQSATPYELFTNPNYNSYTIDGLFYDFGPKWYLQIASDGTVCVPVNANRLQPLTKWCGTECYLAPADLELATYLTKPENNDDFQKWPNIPVAISADKNTITLQKKDYTSPDGGQQRVLYPSILTNQDGSVALFSTKISSEVVLTRGWNEPSMENIRRSISPMQRMDRMTRKSILSPGNSVLKLPQRPMPRTPFPKTSAVKYVRATDLHGVTTAAQIEANLNKYNEMIQQKIRARK